MVFKNFSSSLNNRAEKTVPKFVCSHGKLLMNQQDTWLVVEKKRPSALAFAMVVFSVVPRWRIVTARSFPLFCLKSCLKFGRQVWVYAHLYSFKGFLTPCFFCWLKFCKSIDNDC